MPKEDEFSIASQIKALASKEEYKNPKISPEGYGTFRNVPVEAAQLNKDEVCLPKTDPELENAVKLLLDLLKQHGNNLASDTKKYIKDVRPIIVQADTALYLAQKHNVSLYKDALGWALFNLKLYKITFESPLLPKEDTTQSLYSYFIKELRILNQLFLAKKEKSIEFVNINDIRDGLMQRLNKALWESKA